MKLQLLLIATAFLAQSVGGAETESKKVAPQAEAKAESKADAKTEAAVPAETVAKKEAPVREREGTCLASEEIIQDLETRENALKQKEVAISEREKELEAQKVALKDEMAKLEATRQEIQGIRGKEIAANEEKVNKLIETFESMSPKTAAAVISKVDEELAVTALSRLTTAKAGKILAAMDATKSSRLSEMMAFGNSKNKGKEKENDESHQRAPAAKK